MGDQTSTGKVSWKLFQLFSPLKCSNFTWPISHHITYIYDVFWNLLPKTQWIQYGLLYPNHNIYERKLLCWSVSSFGILFVKDNFFFETSKAYKENSACMNSYEQTQEWWCFSPTEGGKCKTQNTFIIKLNIIYYSSSNKNIFYY